jgi:hypothetical protein
MADPLSIISLRLSVVKGILDYYQTWKDQSEDIQKTIEYLGGLSITLTSLNAPLQNKQLDPIQQANVIKNIHACQDGIRSLERKLNKICAAPSNPTNDDFLGKVRTQARKATYPFRTSTLAKLREITVELRDNLQFAMDAFNLLVHH